MVMRTCLACGQEGDESAVRMTVVEYDDPQLVEVAIAVSHDQSGRVNGNDIRQVPGRYGSEWRCVDRDACVDRVAAESRPKEGAPW